MNKAQLIAKNSELLRSLVNMRASNQKERSENHAQLDALRSRHRTLRKYADEIHAALDALVMEVKWERLAQARLLVAEHHAQEEF